MSFTWPKELGRVPQKWFARGRINEDSMRCCELFTVTALFAAFLDQAVERTSVLLKRCKCFKLMAQIVGLLQYGPTNSALHAGELRALTSEQHSIYKNLHPALAIEPTWHHLLHLPKQVDMLGKSLSCS